jgi:hypothetical protein
VDTPVIVLSDDKDARAYRVFDLEDQEHCAIVVTKPIKRDMVAVARHEASKAAARAVHVPKSSKR